jgi:hypothetical protein
MLLGFPYNTRTACRVLNLKLGFNYHLTDIANETGCQPCFPWERYKPTKRNPADLFRDIFYSHVLTQISETSIWCTKLFNNPVDGVVLSDPWCPKQNEEGKTRGNQNGYGFLFHSFEASAYRYLPTLVIIFAESPGWHICFLMLCWRLDIFN